MWSAEPRTIQSIAFQGQQETNEPNTRKAKRTREPSNCTHVLQGFEQTSELTVCLWAQLKAGVNAGSAWKSGAASERSSAGPDEWVWTQLCAPRPQITLLLSVPCDSNWSVSNNRRADLFQQLNRARSEAQTGAYIGTQSQGRFMRVAFACSQLKQTSDTWEAHSGGSETQLLLGALSLGEEEHNAKVRKWE